MILYITSYRNVEYVERAVERSKKPIMNAMIISNFDLDLYMKQQIEKLQTVEILIIDLEAINNSDIEIYNSLNSFRILYESTKIIVITSLNRDKGDHLLSEIFNMGIYDIIAVTEDQEELEDEIYFSITTGKTYRESLIYKEPYNIHNPLPSTVKEKIIIKNEIRHTVNKACIGFCGTMHRIGVTHNTIVSANYLMRNGFKVAIVEADTNEAKNFDFIKNTFDIKGESEFFTLNNVDYYPDFCFSDIPRILSKNYNFILIDFGLFKSDILTELNRCVIQIIVAGSKPWEIEAMNRVFEQINEIDLQEYTYLFNFTDKAEEHKIIDGMGGLNKVFFSEFTPDPFNAFYYKELDKIFYGYVPETITKIDKRSSLRIKECIKKLKWK